MMDFPCVNAVGSVTASLVEGLSTKLSGPLSVYVTP